MALSELESKYFATLYKYKTRVMTKQIPADDTGNEKADYLSFTEPYPSTITEIKQYQKRLNEQEIQKLIKAYLSGKTVYELANMFSCNRETVSNHLKTSGVKMRRQPPSDEQVEQAIGLYRAGYSCAKSGKVLNLNPSVIWKILKREGVKLRDPHKKSS